ncbi:MAG: Mrp/NBP35 family ATP-binding protein [Prevotellaceae bacterium]|nr:Mrp/NBP35 family ATP-binding protein [Prevotellaceae bacterium]
MKGNKPIEITRENVEAALRGVMHRATGKDIVAMGLVENIQITGTRIRMRLVFPQPDPQAPAIKKEMEQRLAEAFPQAEVKGHIMELVRAPKAAAPKPPATDGDGLAGVRQIVAIASGKGGVGKSTVAVNLAVALAARGLKVGLVDADIYGPSVPKMIAAEGVRPAVRQDGDREWILPVERYGVAWMSIGFFVSPEQPLIWRGPMATNALRQLTRQVDWGTPDILLLDLPPGTGDIHLSMIHDIPLTGAIVVSTPQAVALSDVEKGVNMFLNKNIQVNVLGLVENMAWFTPAELPQNRYYLFGRGGVAALAERMHLPLLAQIPLVQSICESGDSGRPVALNDDAAGNAFRDLARVVDEWRQAIG